MNDLTSGKPLKLLILFSLPMLLSMVFQQMYNVVDSMIAGRFIGKLALAAVGASYPITVLFIAVATGASVGSAVVVSQMFGRKDYGRVKTAAYTTILSIAALALVLTLIGQLACVPLLRMIDTPANIFADSVLYLRVYIWGLLFLFLYNTATSLFNGLGDSRTPLYFLIFSSVLNVVLDYAFVVWFEMGVGGIAWATFLAQGVSSLLAMGVLVFRIVRMEAESRVRKFDPAMLPVMIRVAVPSICQQSFVSVGIFLVQGLINSFGEDTIAAFTAALKVSTFALMCMNTMSNALSSFASQNIGAGLLDRVYEGLKVCLAIAWGMVLVIIVLFYGFGEQILRLFLSGDDVDEVIRQGMLFLHILAPTYFLPVAKNCCDSVLRGGGAMREFMATTFADLLLRVIFSYAFAGLLGFTAVCWAYPIGWVLGTALSVYFFRRGTWKRNLHY